MGWMFTLGASRRDVINELTTETAECKTLRKCLKGNTMYALVESARLNKKFIMVYLLQRSADGWGYKDIDEGMGPVQNNCPVAYLDAADEPMNEYAKKWRESVRALAARRANCHPKIGETWALASGKQVTLKSTKPLHGWIEGRLFRIKRDNLRCVVSVEPVAPGVFG
jgi:hypothetical protein